MRLGRIVHLADQLEQAIRADRLQPGDAYPVTEEIARRLGVSTSAANGALRVLAKRGILLRRQRRGAVVARVPGAQMQFDFIPPLDRAEYANRLVAEILQAGGPEGFVLVRAPLAIQRLVQASVLPAVGRGLADLAVRSLPADEEAVRHSIAPFLAPRRGRRPGILSPHATPGRRCGRSRRIAAVAGWSGCARGRLRYLPQSRRSAAPIPLRRLNAEFRGSRAPHRPDAAGPGPRRCGRGASRAHSDHAAYPRGGAGIPRQVADVYCRFVPGCEEAYLLDTSNHIGLRSSRRLHGLQTVSFDDAWNLRKYPDSIARSSWDLDVWPADSYSRPTVPRDEQRYKERAAKVAAGDYFDIRYGCIVAQGVDDLLMAGKCISAAHEAQSSLRIQQTSQATGQAAGTAAALSLKQRTTPRELDPLAVVAQLEKDRAAVRSAIEPLKPSRAS